MRSNTLAQINTMMSDKELLAQAVMQSASIAEQLRVAYDRNAELQKEKDFLHNEILRLLQTTNSYLATFTKKDAERIKKVEVRMEELERDHGILVNYHKSTQEILVREVDRILKELKLHIDISSS